MKWGRQAHSTQCYQQTQHLMYHEADTDMTVAADTDMPVAASAIHTYTTLQNYTFLTQAWKRRSSVPSCSGVNV